MEGIVENNKKTTKKLGGCTGKGFMPGKSGNPGGRPKGGLKDYDRKKFIEMTDEEKDAFLSRISPEMRYRMAEGNPHQTTDEKVELTLPKPLLGGLSNGGDNYGDEEVAEVDEQN